MRGARRGAAAAAIPLGLGAAIPLGLAAACTGASPDPGLAEHLQVAGGQLRPGPFPAPSGGPAALGVSTRRGLVLLDRFDEPLTATLEPAARAAAIGLVGYRGAWIVRAGPPDADTPGLPSAKATFGLAADLPPGPIEVRVAAADAEGRFGEAATLPLMALAAPPPPGELAIGLVWGGAADLDVHVVDPLGGEAWADDPNTYVPPPPGEPVDPEEYRRHGILDRDANKDCRRDGRPSEYVVWSVPPPAGSYTVRVAARAMCGDPIAHWTVVVYRAGALVTSVRGASVPEEAGLPSGAGAGALALRFAL
jgi:hypothetical protein